MDTAIFIEVRERLGLGAARKIADLAFRVSNRLDEDAAYRWAERVWERDELAILNGTGYDPEDEYRHIDLEWSHPWYKGTAS